jgi:murein L,D-transpeptidase YcbB/YkuD
MKGRDRLTHNEKNDLPENYEELKKAANRTSNWRERLDAVQKLSQWRNKQTIDILTHRMTNDTVYKVQEAAYQKLKQLGEDVHLPAKKKGDLIPDITKVLLRIKKSLPADHTYEQFKEKLRKMRVDVYDTYEGDKGAEFDKWLEQTWASLLKPRRSHDI